MSPRVCFFVVLALVLVITLDRVECEDDLDQLIATMAMNADALPSLEGRVAIDVPKNNRCKANESFEDGECVENSTD